MTFEEFLERELGGLTRFAGALTGNRHSAEDVLADALVKIAERWTKIAAMDSPTAYTRRAIVNTYYSAQRTHLRRRTDPTHDEQLLDRPSTDPASEVVARDEAARLVALLPPKQRVAVVMKYLLDLPDHQIAEELNCTVGTIRSHLSHARATLRLAHDEQLEKE